MDNKQLETLVQKAVSGDKKALEQVIDEIQDLVYNLSLKMLLFPEDAQDASQEILVRVITHLSSFKNNSQFKTWIYRIATNYLLTYKGKQSREFAMSFEDYEQFIDTGQSITVQYARNEGELLLLEEEVKISCTHGLLLCLQPLQRVIYILGEILEFNSKEGSEMLDITPENFRQQLSRSRKKIRSFLENKCGLINLTNPCRCHKKIDFLANQSLIASESLKFAQQTNRSIDLMEQIAYLEKMTAIYQDVPAFKAPSKIKEKIHQLLESF